MPSASVVRGARDHVHEIARRLAVGFLLEGNIQIGCDAEHVHQRPQRETALAVGFQPEIDAHPLGPGGERLGPQ